MKILITRELLGNPRVAFSRLGYHVGHNGSYERRLSSSTFPRLHVYLAEHSKGVEVDIHLDMKPHTYEGFRAHQAEHDSEIVVEEMNRIQQFFQRPS
ncbi:MAG: hypothetical protein WC495_00275 [Patescibacteria group bacterium]|jgi:hypothetical protein